MDEKCEHCGEASEGLYLHSRCHMEVPTWAVYYPDKKIVEIRCAECDQIVTKFGVLEIVK
jgi:hypothetical protein